MNKFTLKQIGDAKINPILASLPDELKDAKKFATIEKKIANIMVSDHKHRKVASFVKCKRCQAKFEKKREYIKSLGFNDIQQYQLWKKVMFLIINKGELVLYEK